jgi:NADH:ubiquinone oxidoreductase subunit F (NADH-binding)
MTGYVMAPAGFSGDVAVVIGRRLLSGIGAGPGLLGHRTVWPAPGRLSAKQLMSLVQFAGILGRGGAGFPFARKLSTALQSGSRRELVVNAAEGEPASAKDSALMLCAPHLVLDGAELVAHALGVRTIRVVVPGERVSVQASVEAAIADREPYHGWAGRAGFRYQVYRTTGGFVGGQTRAALELIEGRENLPVTDWQPAAVAGLNGRPTLLSNAETYAQVAVLRQIGPIAYRQEGTDDEPGTTLLTVAGDGPGGVVIEAPHGVRIAEVLQRCGYDDNLPVLIGGYHGTWLPVEEVKRRRLTRADLSDAGATLGAGVILPLDPSACPVLMTAQIVEYLAGQSALRCGPCKFGLPALADAALMLATHGGRPARDRMTEVTGLVTGRGACAHPDGTSRMVRSLLTAFPDEVALHERGYCAAAVVRPA